MADEIKLKAPTVEQQVVVNINGEEKLHSFADTLEKISNNKNLQKYWKTQQELINATADAYGNFSKKASQNNAKELIKVTNALKAMSGTDLSNILPDFDKISKAMAEAQKVAGNIDSAFSVKGFKEAFDSFETLRAYGVDIQNLFSHFGVSSDVGELQKNVRSLEGEVEKLTRRLTNAKNANEELRNEFDNFKSGSGFADKLDELDNLKSEMSYLREQAEETFRQFLKLNNITEDGYDREGFYDDNRFREYFQNIQSGYMSASDAIRQFKTEYSYLLEESFKTNNDTFGLEQLQAFSNKLDSIFRQVEETSTKINDIISNGVITKSVENLSVDSSLSDSQRSLFGNILKDEESLKSIASLFQKLIEESNKTSKVDLFNDEQLQQVLSIFDKMEKHLSSLMSIISDVGDGEEFSPLLKALNDIKEAASNIKLNFNMDLGDEVSERLNQKVSQASARQLEAYRKLFSAMKGTGKTNKEMLKFFEPDEASVTELIGTYKGIIERAEKQFKVGNSNIYKKYLGAEYDALKREITNANKQLSRADNKRSENGILGDLFGNTKDLSGVIEQLNKIIEKLDEISKSALEFKSTFKEGFNVTASVEEIDKLTNRVKELEDELSKIKLNPVNVDKSNISSDNIAPIIDDSKEVPKIENVRKSVDSLLTDIKGLKHYTDDVFDSFDPNMFGSGIGENRLGNAAYFFDEKNMSDWQDIGEYSKYLTTWSANQVKLFDQTLGFTEEEIERIIKEFYSDLDDDIQEDYKFDLKNIMDDDLYDFRSKFGVELQDVMKSLGYDAVKSTSGEYAFYNTDKLVREVQVYDNEANKIIEVNNKVVQSIKETSSTTSSISPMDDVFQGGSSSAEKLEQDIKNIESATDRATESAKEYRKILSQVGEFDIDSKVSAMYKRNDGQLESWTWRAKKDDDGNVLYDQNGKIDYDEPTVTVISKYEQLEKIIVKADNELRNLQKDLAEIKAYDSNASTTNIEAKITDQKEYIRLLEQTVKVISQSDEYLLDEQQIIDARNKAAREYALTMGSKQEKTDAKQSASDEKKRLANIEQVNRALNKQQIIIDAIEKTYNKSTNPDLDREVSNQQDLTELAQKKLAIQTKINSLQGQERNSANEKEFLELEKLIAEYKELAKYKLKANNPSKQELGGQNLQTLIQVQISNYDKLITKAEKYGDFTSDTVEKLKEQRDILSKIGADGKYTATADQYYASRDTYKVESASLSAFEAETKAIEQKTQAVKRLKDELEGYNKQIPKKPIDGQRSDKFEGFVQNYKNAIEEARKYLDTLGDSPITKEVKDEWERLIDVIKKAKEEMDAVPNAARGSDALSRGKEIDTITKYLNKFTGISKQAKQELNGLLKQLQSGDPSVNVKKIHERFLELTVAEREAGREARNLFDIFKDKKIYSFLGQAASMFSFYDIINVARQAGQAVIDLNTNITELAKVSEATSSQIYDDFNSYADIAKEVGGTISDTIRATADWSRNGYNIPDAKELAEVAMIYKNVGDGIDIDQANEYLISTLRGFKLEAKDAMDIIDSINEVANNEPISSAGIGEALQRSAAAFNVANTSLQESIALVTSTNSVLQSPEKVGSMWTTVSARIRGAKTELEDVGLETDGMVESTSKLQSLIKGMTGFDILEDDQKTFKSIYDIIIGIGEEFQNLSGVDQAALLEALAGKRQSNALAATLNNIDLLKKAYGEATNAEGSAMAEQEKYQQSIQYSIDRTKASLEELANDFISSDFLKGLIDSGDKLINILDLLIDKFGVLGTTAIVGGGILGKQNLGKTYKCTVFKLNCFEYALYA